MGVICDKCNKKLNLAEFYSEVLRYNYNGEYEGDLREEAYIECEDCKDKERQKRNEIDIKYEKLKIKELKKLGLD